VIRFCYLLPYILTFPNTFLNRYLNRLARKKATVTRTGEALDMKQAVMDELVSASLRLIFNTVTDAL
jgi:hypothetical protein